MTSSTTASRGLRILISGSSGMVGKALVQKLSIPSPINNYNPQIFRLVRTPQPKASNEIYWDPYEMRIDINKCEGMDVVIHLAGMYKYVIKVMRSIYTLSVLFSHV